MIKSREYALERLDEWYADRFRNHYTDDVAIEMMGHVVASAKKINDEGLESVLHSVLNGFSREEQIKDAERYFSQTYATMEAMVEGMSIGEFNLKEVPPGVKEEYFDPVLRQYEKLQRFVEQVRKISDQDLSMEITEDDINQTFMDVMGGHEGFSEFSQTYIESFPILFDLLTANGSMPRKLSDLAMTLLNITKEKIPYMTEAVFGDLKRSA
ncbi:hypothetical protein HOE04_04080 [archaeon]|jgi:hypothetical protein|nr:hypothetical protein [archaeon]